MKNLNLKFNFKSLVLWFKINTTVIFFIGLAAILVFEFFIFYKTYRQVEASRSAPDNLIPPKGVRFNFTEYQQAVNRIQAGKDFYPGPPLFENPFGTQQ